MWSKIAGEMGVPWRAVEAMHWQLGEADMARRAGVIPFSLSSVTIRPILKAQAAIHALGLNNTLPRGSDNKDASMKYSKETVDSIR